MSLNYVMIGSNDPARSKNFYDAVMRHLGAEPLAAYEGVAYCYQMRDGGRVWVARPYDEQPATPGNGMMPGFLCESEAAVQAAHAAAIENGGVNEGDPGPRPQYGPEFYGAYVRDPDGNKMSFIFLRGNWSELPPDTIDQE